MIKDSQMTVYSLFCDQCGKQYENDEGNTFADTYDLTTYASEDGWLEDGVDEDDDGPMYLSEQSEHHFCSEKCREEWLAKKEHEQSKRSCE